MASTTHGWPYPVGTDRVMDGDNAMQALAQKGDDMTVFTTGLPRCKIVAAATQTLTNNVTTKVTLGTMVYDTNAMADVANSQIVVKTAGWYRFWARVVWASGTTGLRNVWVVRSGVNISEQILGVAAGVTMANVSPSEPVQCAVNDAFFINAAHTQGANLDLTLLGPSRSWLIAEMVGY